MTKVNSSEATPTAGADGSTKSSKLAVGESQKNSESNLPRIVKERHFNGPHGEDEVEAIDDRGQRWYSLRPQPAGPADFMGYNRRLWLSSLGILLVIALLFII
jgi:hypothetical protein